MTVAPSNFTALFEPRAIAIIGASGDVRRIGGHSMKALRAAGFKGQIYPINPKYPELGGLACYPSVEAAPKPMDLAIIAVPAAGVPDAIRSAGKAGISFAVVLTAGFRETGPDGIALEADVARAVLESGVRIVGPNCQGMISVQSRVWAVFGSIAEMTDLRPGTVSCAFQSGGFGYAIVNLAEQQGVGFRHCVSTGNETDITTPELLGAFLDDPGTELAVALMEGSPDARRLLDVGRRSLELSKPVLIWKSANTPAGAKAAASHTASMTGEADIWRAAFRQSGLIEVDDVEPIVDISKLVAQRRFPKGNRIGVLSISGGSGIVYADRCTREGTTLPPFADTTVAALKKIIPAFGSSENPADVTAGVFNDIGLLTKTMEIVLADPGIDQVSVLLASIPGAPASKAAEAIVAAAATSDKPVHVGWSGRRDLSEDAYRLLEAANIAVIPTPVRLAQAASVLARFTDNQRRLLGRTKPPASKVSLGSLKLPEGAVTLSERESKAVLDAYGITTSHEVVVPEGGDVTGAAAKLSAPYAVKIVSRDIAHKSDIGGVKLGLATPQAAAEAAMTVVANARVAIPTAKIDGVLVAEMASGIEALIGVINDPAFGPTVALGLGGVLTELLGDVTYRIAPFDLPTAHDMIGELKGAKLFAGYRGAAPANVDALAQMLVQVSVMATALGDRLAELDINPVFVNADRAVAADALMVLR
jgi:acetate---CoA ligase (ADP-forming)